MKLLFLLVTILFSSVCLATDAITARVVQAGIYGNGQLLVILDTEIPEPGCVGNRFDVPRNHPSIDSYLTLALAAAASKTDVTVRTHGCASGRPTIDETENSLFLFSNE